MIERSLPSLPLELLESVDFLPLTPPIKAANCLKQLRRLDTLFGAELELLKKIRYKQKNQHRSATWWRHLTGAQRIAVRFNEEFTNNLLVHFEEIKYVFHVTR
jgi:hypothetical protein